MEEKVIHYKNNTLHTMHHKSISTEKYLKLKEEFYEKPSFDSVKQQFITIERGGVKHDKITNYYYKDLMAKTRLYYSKWSIEDVWNCKELVEYFYAKTLTNDKVFPKTSSDIKNIETAFSLGGKGIASKPSNFPFKTANHIISKYNVNNNYYDFSCGWGVRLLAALKNEVNYFGTDPNYELVERLNQMSRDYKAVHNKKNLVNIKPIGSETFCEEWSNTIGLAFSSPPYFNLEDYKIGNQSWKDDVSYEDWKNSYLRPTIKNIYAYLIRDGFFLININNFNKLPLVEDTIAISQELGFTLHGTEVLKNIKRCNSKGGLNNNDEKILVFRKM